MALIRFRAAAYSAYKWASQVLQVTSMLESLLCVSLPLNGKG